MNQPASMRAGKSATVRRLVVILATVMPFLASWWPPAAVLAYVVALSPLLRLIIGIENAWVDMALPLLLFVLMLIMYRDWQNKGALHEDL